MTIDLIPPVGSGRAAVPRKLTSVRERSDRIFHGTAGGIGMVVLAITAGIGLYLGYQAIPTLRHYGLSFFTQTQWLPELDRIGIAAVLVGTAEVALVAMVVSFPLALCLALFVSDYAPKWTKSWLVSAVDLMAAVPSIIYCPTPSSSPVGSASTSVGSPFSRWAPTRTRPSGSSPATPGRCSLRVWRWP
jgi:phosphate transport system permease protein